MVNLQACLSEELAEFYQRMARELDTTVERVISDSLQASAERITLQKFDSAFPLERVVGEKATIPQAIVLEKRQWNVKK